jgi:hypothetical protein
LGKKIYSNSKEAEEFWIKLCKINPNYSKALNLYGWYLIDIKNHNQLGYELLEKYEHFIFNFVEQMQTHTINPLMNS